MDPNQYQQPQYPQQPYPPTYEQPPASQQASAYGYPPPNAYPGYAPPMPNQTSGMAIASLVLSLLGFFILAVIGPVLGIIFGHMALGEIKRSNGTVEGQGLAVAGLVIGYIGLGIQLLFACIIVLGILVAANSPGSTTGLGLPMLSR
jgi:Domain of unknown function (DUF4190)